MADDPGEAMRDITEQITGLTDLVARCNAQGDYSELTDEELTTQLADMFDDASAKNAESSPEPPSPTESAISSELIENMDTMTKGKEAKPTEDAASEPDAPVSAGEECLKSAGATPPAAAAKTPSIRT